MTIKEADDKESDIAILEGLANRVDVIAETRKKIEKEIRTMRSGIKGEKDAAYEIDFHFRGAKNYAVIHDLRIEVEDRVAQIDHLMINRFLDMWVCETKNFSGGIAINEEGEFTGFSGRMPYAMASPIEQNRKHLMVLESMFRTGMVELPKRLGFSIKPKMNSVVLVSKTARITRPEAKVEGVERIIKSDQFRSMVERANESDNNPLTMAKLIGVGTLEAFAREIAAQHKPIAFRWAAKFGLSDVGEDSTLPKPAPAVALGGDETGGPIVGDVKKQKKKLICDTCAEVVEYNVARFCWFNKPRFGEKIYCRECQKAV